MRSFEKEDLYGAVATFNADPFCIENEDDLNDVWSYVCNGFHLIVDSEDYEVACAELDLDSSLCYDIYESDDFMVKFCVDF